VVPTSYSNLRNETILTNQFRLVRPAVPKLDFELQRASAFLQQPCTCSMCPAEGAPDPLHMCSIVAPSRNRTDLPWYFPSRPAAA